MCYSPLLSVMGSVCTSMSYQTFVREQEGENHLLKLTVSASAVARPRSAQHCAGELEYDRCRKKDCG